MSQSRKTAALKSTLTENISTMIAACNTGSFFRWQIYIAYKDNY